jgi:hypothetical protein
MQARGEAPVIIRVIEALRPAEFRERADATRRQTAGHRVQVNAETG